MVILYTYPVDTLEVSARLLRESGTGGVAGTFGGIGQVTDDEPRGKRWTSLLRRGIHNWV
jgi:hypothetical protein